MRLRLLFMVAVVAGIASTLAPQPVRGESDLLAAIDAGFEVDGDGWSIDGGTLQIVATPGPHAGAAAGRVTANAAGAVVLATKWWLVTAQPGSAYTTVVWVRESDPNISLAAELTFFGADGSVLDLPASEPLSGDSPTYRAITVGPAPAPTAAAYVSVSVRGVSTAGGAAFHVDAATLTRDDPAPTPTPTATATATADPTPTSTAPVPSPTATSSPAPTATAVPTPTPLGTAPSGACTSGSSTATSSTRNR